MTTSIKNLYEKIKKDLTVEHLKKITVDVINAYRGRNFRRLRKYVTALDLDPDVQNARLFSTLVMKFHPDRLSLVMKQVEDLYRAGDGAGLKMLHDGYFFDIAAAEPAPDLDLQYEEKYAFDEEDFAYREEDLADVAEYRESGLDWGEEEHGFLEAVHRLFAGGLDVTITATDLMDLEGALDLSDYDIEDLEGAQHCVYVNELNLSNNRIEKLGNLSELTGLFYLFLANNRIENIKPLEGLAHLKELDISFNNISDISPLLKLGELEYVNLLGNPVRDYSVVDRLVKKGIIVIFEGNILT
jgi:hypothetical protein